MTVPSKSWGVITDGQVDADSPLDTTLITALRDNLVHLEEWLGDGYTAAKDHDHDGVNSKILAAPSIQSEGSQTVAATSTWTPSVGTYQWVVVSGGGNIVIQLYISGSWRTGKSISNSGFIHFDGANMKLKEVSAINTPVWYQKFN